MSVITPTIVTAANTFGWDTVFALHLAEVNAAINHSNLFPKPFSQQKETVSVSGTLGGWQVGPGGSGQLVYLIIPITSGSLTYVENKTPTTIKFPSVTVTVEVTLGFFEESTPPSASATGTFHKLKINTVNNTPGTNPPVQALQVQSPGGSTPFMVQALLPVLLTQWLQDNLTLFDYVFATINLNRVADQGAFAWLLPTTVAYAYTDNAYDENDGVLAVLCMTGRRPAPTTAELTVNAIPDGARAGFLINKVRFLEDLVLPGLPLAYPGATVTDFALTPDQTGLTLLNSLSLKTESDGKQYDTTLTALSISITDSTIQMSSQCVTEISAGIQSHVSSVHHYIIVLETSLSGNPRLNYQEVGVPVVNHWTTTSETIKIIDDIEIAIGVLVTIVAAILSDGASILIEAVVIAAIVGVVTQIPNMIAEGGVNDAPDLTLLAFNVADPIQWAGEQHFQLTTAALNESLQLGGAFLLAESRGATGVS